MADAGSTGTGPWRRGWPWSPREPTWSTWAARAPGRGRSRYRSTRSSGGSYRWFKRWPPMSGYRSTAAHNLSLLHHLDELVATGFPVLIGASRKSFIGRLTGDAAVDDRLEGSLAVAVWAMEKGAAMVRVHDVRATVQAARLVAA